MTATEISLLIIALAFVALVFYLIKTLKEVQGSLKQLNTTMIHMKDQIDEVSKETTELLKNTNQITLDVQKKSKALDSIFESVENVGTAMKQVTHSAKEVSSTLSQSIQKSVTNTTNQHQDKLSELIRLTNLGFDLWKKWQALKSSRQHKKDTVSQNGHVQQDSSNPS